MASSKTTSRSKRRALLSVAVLSLYCLFIPFLFSGSARAATAPTDDIEDIIAKHHFTWIGNIFTDGTVKFLCVETDNHEYGLWNPLTDHLSATIPEKQRQSASIDEKCEHPGLHWLGTDQELNHMMVNRLPIGGVPANDTSHSNFGDGATLSLVFDMYSKRCGPNLASYFTLTHRDGKTDSFYIVVRFKRPQLYVAENCDDSDDPKQELILDLDSIWQLNSVDLGDGRTLLFSNTNRYAPYGRGPVVLIVREIPNSVWSSDGNVFIIPTNLLRPQLMKDRWRIKDLSVRYNALLRVIGKLPQKGSE
jgi:hypothetical protein